MFSILREQKGSIAVLTALSIIVLVGFTAIVTDLGMLYLNRSQLVNTADAAALAGVQELPGRSSAAVDSAYNFALQNGKAGDNIRTSLESGNTRLTVSVSRDVTLFFARIFKRYSQTVSASATAAVRPMGSVGGAVPFGIVKQPFVYGTTYRLKEGPGDGYHGNYDPLAFGTTGASNFRDNVKFGYKGKLQVGQWVPTETGNMAGPTGQAVSYRVGLDPTATFETVSSGSPRIIVIPIIDSLQVSGRSEVLIVGFGAFFLEGTGKNGNENYVYGRFIQMVASGDATGPGNGSDYGLYAATLTK